MIEGHWSSEWGCALNGEAPKVGVGHERLSCVEVTLPGRERHHLISASQGHFGRDIEVWVTRQGGQLEENYNGPGRDNKSMMTSAMEKSSTAENKMGRNFWLPKGEKLCFIVSHRPNIEH